MIENPFSVIDRRLNKIEALLLKITEEKFFVTRPEKKKSQNSRQINNETPKIEKEAVNG